MTKKQKATLAVAALEKEYPDALVSIGCRADPMLCVRLKKKSLIVC